MQYNAQTELQSRLNCSCICTSTVSCMSVPHLRKRFFYLKFLTTGPSLLTLLTSRFTLRLFFHFILSSLRFILFIFHFTNKIYLLLFSLAAISLHFSYYIYIRTSIQLFLYILISIHIYVN